jgi:hypothetical protein
MTSAEKQENTSLTVADKLELDVLDHGLLPVGLYRLYVTRCIWNKYKAFSILSVISLVGVFILYHSDMSTSV